MTEASPYDGTDEDLIEHMLEHIDDMECAVNDLYHHLFADRMRIHLRDMKNRCASHSSVTTSAEQVLGERVLILENKVSELYRAIKQLHEDTAGDRKIGTERP